MALVAAGLVVFGASQEELLRAVSVVAVVAAAYSQGLRDGRARMAREVVLDVVRGDDGEA